MHIKRTVGSTFVKDHFCSPPIHNTDQPLGSMMHCCFYRLSTILSLISLVYRLKR